VILTSCAVEFDAADTDKIDFAAASRRRQKPTPHKTTDEGSRVKMPYVPIFSDNHKKKLANQNLFGMFLSGL